MHPIIYVDYPPVMQKNVGSRLPSFTDEERKKVKGSFDFVGFNHYIVVHVRADLNQLKQKLRDYMGDAAVKFDSKSPKSLYTFVMVQSTVVITDELNFCSTTLDVRQPVPDQVDN